MLLQKTEDLEVIVKITERCNIDCSYCYMFNKGNDDFEFNPPYIGAETISQTLAFLERGIADLGVKRLAIILHGGEPLMLKKERFVELCDAIESRLKPLVKLTMGIQTNAILIDDEWLEIFGKYDFHVGVSLDGPEEVNDRYRIDKKGAGTYKDTVAGLERLQKAYSDGRLRHTPGVVCVCSFDADATELYRFFAQTLKVKLVNFNLPMETHDDWGEADAKKARAFLADLFEAWVSDDDPAVKIRMFDHMLRYFSGDVSFREHVSNIMRKHLMVVISSAGELSDHDDYKIINFAQRGGTVFDTTLQEFSNSQLRRYIDQLFSNLPGDCQECSWKYYCRGGVSQGLGVTRYSKKNGFNNRSTMCDGLGEVYARGASFLLKNGLTPDRLASSLGALARDAEVHDVSLQLPPNDFLTDRKTFFIQVPKTA